MSTEKPVTEVIGVSMIRETLDDLPLFDLPAPYTLRWYQPGDELYWVDIHKAADPAHAYSLEMFAREFEVDRALLPMRQAYLCSGDGKPVELHQPGFTRSSRRSLDWYIGSPSIRNIRAEVWRTHFYR